MSANEFLLNAQDRNFVIIMLAICLIFFLFIRTFVTKTNLPAGIINNLTSHQTSMVSGMGSGTSSVIGYFLILFFALSIRLYMATLIDRPIIDVGNFRDWAMYVSHYGLDHTYSRQSQLAFNKDMLNIDYPPGYIYVLYVLGKLRVVLSLNPGSSTFLTLVKMPAIIFDVITVDLIYRLSKKKSSRAYALGLSSLYAFNPAIIINSAVWGQVDSCFTLFVLVSVILMVQRRLLAATVVFMLSILIKPQSLIFSPLLALTYADELYRTGIRSTLKSLLLSASASLFILAFVLYPFSHGINPIWIIDIYKKLLSEYPNASSNAFNFFTLTGGNVEPDSSPFLFLTYAKWGYIFITLAVIYVTLLYYKTTQPQKLYFMGFFLMAATFCMGSRMHERYLYPALIFILISSIYFRHSKLLVLYGGFSITLFINQFLVVYVIYVASKITLFFVPLFFYAVMFCISGLNVILFIYTIKYSIEVLRYNSNFDLT